VWKGIIVLYYIIEWMNGREEGEGKGMSFPLGF